MIKMRIAYVALDDWPNAVWVCQYENLTSSMRAQAGAEQEFVKEKRGQR